MTLYKTNRCRAEASVVVDVTHFGVVTDAAVVDDDADVDVAERVLNVKLHFQAHDLVKVNLMNLRRDFRLIFKRIFRVAVDAAAIRSIETPFSVFQA